MFYTKTVEQAILDFRTGFQRKKASDRYSSRSWASRRADRHRCLRPRE
ncbi:hypothetical protein HBB16_01735 [Pseudonocardia sp. MCCB 268]|nr:hypothetical protein [Pseudonocardia cytotoxica]